MMDKNRTPQIGPFLQRERRARNFTLEQLASLSGVSKSMLSQIERGEANPTFAVLWSLTRALKIEFSDLFRSGATASESAIELVTSANTPEFKSTDGTCRLLILSPPGLAGHTEWYEVEIAPSGVLDSAPHALGTTEHFTAFNSGFEVRSGAAVRHLKAGETARYAADVPHRITNLSAKRAKGVMVVIYK